MTAGITSFQNGSFLNGTAGASALTTSGGVSISSFLNTEYLENRDRYNQTNEGIEIAATGRDAAIESKISKICSYLSNGQEDKAMAAYEELLQEMNGQTRYSNLVSDSGDDTQLRSVARQLIEGELGGDLEEYIRENTRDAAGVEAQKIRTLGNCDSTSQEDLLLAMCDIEEDEGHNILLDAVSAIAMPFEVLGNLIFNGGKKVK